MNHFDLPPFYSLPPTREGVPGTIKGVRPQSPLSSKSEERRVLTAFCDRHSRVGRWEKLCCECTEQIKLVAPDNVPGIVSCYEERASAWSHLGKWERAVSDYTNALELAPNNPRLLAERANAHCMLNKWRDAINDCTLSLRASPTLYKDKKIHGIFCAEVFGNRSVALRMLGLFEKSVEDCDKALVMDPTKSMFHLKNRYFSNRALERWQLVVSDLDSMIRLDPLDAQLWIARGVCLGKLARSSDAKRSFDAALHLEPNNISALLNRGIANGSLGDWKGSLEDCERALTFNDKSVMAWRTLAHAKSQLGRLEDAVKDFTTALELSPGDWSLLLNRATANGRLSRWEHVVYDTSIILGKNNISNGAIIDASNGHVEDEDDRLEGVKREQLVMALTHRISARRALKILDSALLDCERLFHFADTQDAQVSALATRALVYSELSQWDDAIGDCDAATLLFSDPESTDTSTKKPTEDERGKGTLSGKNLNLSKLGRLKQWIIAQKEQETKEATESADRMARLLIAEENSNVWNEAYVTTVSSTRNLKKKQRKLRKKHKNRRPIAGAAEEEHESEEEAVGVEIEEEINDSKEGDEEEVLTGSTNGLQVNNISPVDEDAPTIDEVSPMSPTSPAPKPPVEASPRTVYEKIFRSVKMLEKTLSDATKLAKESAIKTASSSLSTVKEGISQSYDDKDEAGVDDSNLNPRKLFSESEKNTVSSINEGLQDVKISKEVEHVSSVKRSGKLQWDEDNVLGRGSFGTVVMSGVHVDWGEIAVKSMMRGHHEPDPEQGRVLDLSAAAERDIMSVMSRTSAHVNVVRYFGVEEDEHRIYLAIEKCAYSLHDLYVEDRLIKTRNELQGNKKRLTKLVGELMSALEFLHCKGVVHGDLRPRNVLFLSDGVLKLSDFGLARQVTSDEEDASFTWSHTAPTGMGGWFAPEVCRQQRKTKAVDIFSAGCVIYFALTRGEHPFNGCAFDVVDQKSNFEHLHDMEAVSLVKHMVSNEPSSRPTVAAVLAHPFLWLPHKRLAYLEEVGNKLDRFKGVLDSTYAIDWTSEVDSDLYASMTRFRSYSSSTSDLIRFIRNLDQHFTDQEEKGIRVLMDSLQTKRDEGECSDHSLIVNSTALQRDSIEAYFFNKFPTLIIAIWSQLGTEF